MDTALSRLTPSTRAEECHRAIKSAILTLELLPGTTLDESALASQLGVSKTPVRESLFRLAGERLVNVGVGKSTVSDLSLEDIRQIYRARIIIESASVREVAPTFSDNDIRNLEELVAKSERALQADSYREFLKSSEEFHYYLLNCSKNDYLIASARHLFDQAARVRASIYRAEENLKQHSLSFVGIQNHRIIVDALRERDPEAAAAAVRADIGTFLDQVGSPVIQDALPWLGKHD